MFPIDSPGYHAMSALTHFDAQGQAQLRWHTSDPAQSASGSRFPGVLDLHGQLQRADGTRVHRYLPLVIPAEKLETFVSNLEAHGDENKPLSAWQTYTLRPGDKLEKIAPTLHGACVFMRNRY